MSEIINIFEIFATNIIIFYLIKNNEIIINVSKKILQHKKIKIVFLIVFLLLFVVIIVKNVYETFEKFSTYSFIQKEQKEFEIIDNEIISENKLYKELMKKEYDNQNYSSPYIPSNFEYLEGEWNNGFVIQDEKQNQYVWVPCTNKDIENIPILQKDNFSKNVFISKEECYSGNQEEFIKSCLKNGGFYISRFEIGKQDNSIVSKKDVPIYSDVTKDEAEHLIQSLNKSEEYKIELLNSYAYDTALSWILNSNKIIVSLDEDKKITGRKQYNRIYDLLDDVLEMTTEKNYKNIIIRGCFYYDVKENDEVDLNEGTRYSIQENETSKELNDKLAFRTVLYK